MTKGACASERGFVAADGYIPGGRLEEAIESAEHTVGGTKNGWGLLEARWIGPVIMSHAQNAEDVRLWRVLGSRPNGFYIDVGPGDPMVGSVTQLFYDSGWSGINVAPGPLSSAPAATRLRDVNLELTIEAEARDRGLWVRHLHPDVTSLARTDPSPLSEGSPATMSLVCSPTLEEVVTRHGSGRPIDFLRIDVEGAERSVLESFDPRLVRPSVVLVDAISPIDHQSTHDDWEPLLLAAGYTFAAFDGINRFYVPSERADLAPALAYPISALDRFETYAVAARRSELVETRLERDRLIHDLAVRDVTRLETAARDATGLVREMEHTYSWRVTRPLRVVRRLQRRITRPGGSAEPSVATASVERAFAERLTQVRVILTHEEERTPDGCMRSPEQALVELEELLDSSRQPASVTAWLCLAAVDGSYPHEDEADAATRLLRTLGPPGLIREMEERFSRAVKSGFADMAHLDVVEGLVVVDASHSVTTDHHTGIQRVVRETLARWIVAEPSVRLAVWDDDRRCLRLLAEREAERLCRWRTEMNESGAPIATRVPEQMSGNTLIPLDCYIVLPEVPHPARSRGLRSLVRASVHDRLAVIGFDLIPIVAAETMTTGMTDTFCEFLSLVKHANRVSAISAGAAESFRAFNDMLVIEGIDGPEVGAHPLPTEVPEVTAADIKDASRALELSGAPVILVVGSHEPRKNHLAILEAAERLWTSGLAFELLMIGGSEWRFEEFRRYSGRLADAGWPINVRRRITDTELWSAYRIARFSVFPSLLEGFGLPVAESLASGTPVITSRHGNMAEIAAGGGALLVDPRNVDDLEVQMRRLLTDDDLYDRLRREALARDLGNWDDYARDVWSFLTGEPQIGRG